MVGIIVAFNVGLMISLVVSCVLDGRLICVDKTGVANLREHDDIDTGEIDNGGQLPDKSGASAGILMNPVKVEQIDIRKKELPKPPSAPLKQLPFSHFLMNSYRYYHRIGYLIFSPNTRSSRAVKTLNTFA